jgi:hypothetical protein
MVSDQHIYGTKSLHRSRHNMMRRIGVGEVSHYVPEAVTFPAQRIYDAFCTGRVGTPRLVGIVGSPRLHQHQRALREEPLSHGEPDPRPPAHTSDQRNPPGQQHSNTLNQAATATSA